jgi:hypothetical protein
MGGIAAKLDRFASPDGHDPTAGIRAIERASTAHKSVRRLGLTHPGSILTEGGTSISARNA